MGKSLVKNWVDWLEKTLLWGSIFLMSWQLRHTILFAEIGGGYFEYASWQIYASDIIIGLLLVVGWLKFGRQVFRPLPPMVGLPLLVLMAWMMASVTVASNWQLTVAVTLHWWLAAVWCGYLVNRVKKIDEIVWPLVIGLAVQGGVGIGQYLMNHSVGLNWLGESVLDPKVVGVSVIELDGFRHLRAYGLMPHPNIFGGMMVLGMVGVLGLVNYLKQINRWQWVALAVMGLVFGVGVAWSFSRTVWLVALGVLVVWVGVSIIRRQSAKVRLVLIMLVSVLVAMLAQLDYVKVRFDLTAPLEEQSIRERGLGFSEWQKIISQHPNGVGVGNYSLSLTQVEPNRPSWWYAPVHNIYLLMVGELGPIGLAIWAWMVWALAKLVWLSRPKVSWELVVPIVAWLGLGMTDHWLVSLQQGVLFFFVALALIILGHGGMITGERGE